MFPLILGTAAAGAAWRYSAYPILPSTDVGAILSFGGSIAAISTTMLGFMLAALAVLASINHTHLVKMMKKTGHYKNLLSTLFNGCLIFLFCASAGYAILFGFYPRSWFLTALIGLHVGALVSIIDIGRKFWLVLNNLSVTE
ncbi:MAG: hypothetical protein Q7K57_45305 [Burkholderiaceae bacterium]|nr:hypothetical protein [Burkholderiaceae bacterium]